MHDLPRKLTEAELAVLFEGRTRLVERLAECENPLADAPAIARDLDEADKVAALNAHPAIGASKLSPVSRQEQGIDDGPETLAELARLNALYEEKFGFRFVVFVNGRSKAELVPVLRERLGRTREDELETGLAELVAIARERWRRL